MFEVAKKIGSDKSRQKEVRIPQAVQLLEQAAVDFKKLGMNDWHHECLAESLELEASLLKDQTGRRGDRIALLGKSVEQWNKAADYAKNREKEYLLRRASSANVRILKLEGIELQHDLKIEEAERKFSEAMNLEDAGTASGKDGVLWTKAALLETKALGLTNDLMLNFGTYSEEERVLIYDKIVGLYDEAIDLHNKAREKDERALEFCLAIRAMFNLIRRKDHEAYQGWVTYKQLLPPEIFQSKRQSKRFQLRRIYLMIADELMPTVRREESEIVRQEVVSKLKGLEAELKISLNELRKKRPRAGLDQVGKPITPSLGNLFRVFRDELGVQAPPVLDRANRVILVGAKHDNVVSLAESQEAIQVIGSALLDGTFDEAIDQYMQGIDHRVKDL